MSRITQSDLARRLGLSAMAVSMALRGHPGVSAATRDKVRALAEEIGYRPDVILSELARQRWKRSDPAYLGTVAFIVRERRLINERGVQESLLAIPMKERLATLGYGIEVYGQDEYTPRALGRVLRQRGVEGIVYTRLVEGDWRAAFPWDRFASVALNYGQFEPVHHAVILERFANIIDLWALFRQRGFQRVGLIGYDERNARDHAISEAAMIYASRLHYGADPLPALRIPPGTPQSHKIKAIREWRAVHLPDVVVAWNVPLYEAATLAWPRKESFHGCIFCLTQHDSQRQAGYIEDYTSMANTAVDLLHGQLRLGRIGLASPPHRAVVSRFWRDGPEVRGEAPARAQTQANSPAQGAGAKSTS